MITPTKTATPAASRVGIVEAGRNASYRAVAGEREKTGLCGLGQKGVFELLVRQRERHVHP